jgi:hypothetical protein
MSTLKRIELCRHTKENIAIDDEGGEVKVTIYGYPYMPTKLDFHEVKKLYWWLDGWMDKERENCSSCQHERSGCQYHDAD